jgi:VWFA-related protein
MNHLHRRRFLLGAASLCGARWLARAQDDIKFTTEVKVVSVLVNVRTKQGEIVHNLTKDDFSLAENGRPQTIRYFSRDTGLPLTIGLMVDTSMSQVSVLDAERGASLRFLDQVLRENQDQMFIMQFDMAVQTPQPLTSSRAKLNEALSYVNTPSRGDLSMQTGGGTLLYDAVLKASKEIMTNQKNRKALILLTDGVDTGSEATAADAITAAQRADTLIYSILFSDPGAYGISFLGHEGRTVLMRMSRETGGGFFEVTKKQSIESIFAAIEDELRSQYNLGFISDTPVEISEFRKLQVSTRQKGLIVQARERYWARR